MDRTLFRNLGADGRRRTPLVIAAMVVGALTAGLGGTTYAAQKVAACSKSITACGCQVKKPGTYNVTADLSSSQGLTPDGDCIEVKASRVTLDLNSHAISGPGGTNTDIGIDVMKGSNYDTIVGGSPDAKVSGWETGVEDSGRNDSLTEIDASSNSLDGVEISKGSNDQLTSWSADNNGTFGAWIKQGSGDSLSGGGAHGNGLAGIFVGCSAGGPSGEDCSGEGESKNNDLHDDSVDQNGSYGIALDSNSADTTVDSVSGSGNGSDDLLDDSCSGDSFSSDSFSSSSNSCSSGSDS